MTQCIRDFLAGLAKAALVLHWFGESWFADGRVVTEIEVVGLARNHYNVRWSKP